MYSLLRCEYTVGGERGMELRVNYFNPSTPVNLSIETMYEPDIFCAILSFGTVNSPNNYRSTIHTKEKSLILIEAENKLLNFNQWLTTDAENGPYHFGELKFSKIFAPARDLNHA